MAQWDRQVDQDLLVNKVSLEWKVQLDQGVILVQQERSELLGYQVNQACQDHLVKLDLEV